MRYTGIWEDQRLLRDRERKKYLFLPLFVIPISSVVVCVCPEGCCVFFSFLIIFFLHVHVKYCANKSHSHKTQILYHCCCHVCLAQWCFLPNPPAHIMFATVIILFTGYGPIKTACDDLSHMNSSWWGMTLLMKSGISPWLTGLWHSSTSCLCVWCGLGALCCLWLPPRPSSCPALQHSLCLPRAKNQIWHKAA